MASTMEGDGGVALHGSRVDEHRGWWEAPGQYVQDVRSAAPVGELITPMRRGNRGKAALPLQRKEALRGKFRLEALELVAVRAPSRLPRGARR